MTTPIATLSPNPTPLPPTPTMAPDSADVAVFEKMMGDISPISTETASPVADPSNLGDAILDGMRRLSDTHDAQVEKVQNLVEATDGSPMTFQDGVRLQFELMQLHMQQDITTKSADKTSQGIQTLFRNQ